MPLRTPIYLTILFIGLLACTQSSDENECAPADIACNSWIASMFHLNPLTDTILIGAGVSEATICTMFASHDGRTWIPRLTLGSPCLSLRAVAHNGTRSVGVGGGSSSECYLVVSENGRDWNRIDCPPDARDLYDIIVVDGVFYAVGAPNASTNATVITSGDGLTWNSWNTGGATFTYQTILYNSGNFYVVGGTGNGVSVSSDPTSVAFAGTGSPAVTYNNLAANAGGAMLAVSGSVASTYTPDGSNWSTPAGLFSSVPSGEAPFAVTAFGNGFLTGGGGVSANDSCIVDSSTDGFNYIGGSILDANCTGNASEGFAIFRNGFVRNSYWMIGYEIQTGTIREAFIAYAANPTATAWDYVMLNNDSVFDVIEISGD